MLRNSDSTRIDLSQGGGGQASTALANCVRTNWESGRLQAVAAVIVDSVAPAKDCRFRVPAADIMGRVHVGRDF